MSFDFTPAPPAPAPCRTIAEVVVRISADETLEAVSRRNMLAAIRTLCRVLSVPPNNVPTDPSTLRALIAAANIQRDGITASRWQNVRSLTLKALRRCAIPVNMGRSDVPLLPEWERLSCMALLPEQRFRLSRFMRFCSARQVLPEYVTEADFRAFYDTLREQAVNLEPKAVYRKAAMAWNKAAGHITGWPGQIVPVPSFTRRYALTWDSFPASFECECRAFLQHSGNQDPFAVDYAPSVKPSTINMRRRQILQMATILVEAGVPATDITGLAVLTDPSNAAKTLRQARKRAGNTNTKYLHQHASLLRTIAAHWVKAPADKVAVLADYASRLAPRQTGMVEKNRTRLAQFDNPANVERLVMLPRRVFAELARSDLATPANAVRALYALTVEILINAPMRVSNLVALELGRHMTMSGPRMHVRIPASETKTGERFEANLPPGTSQMVATFIDRYRPHLAGAPTSLLFPGRRADVPRTVTRFATCLSKFIRRETGLEMNPHLFRHFVTKLVLDDNPADIETARRILGHRNTSTTERAYADRATASAFTRYDKLIERALAARGHESAVSLAGPPQRGGQ